MRLEKRGGTMKRRVGISGAALLAVIVCNVAVGFASDQRAVRVATYNIKFLNADTVVNQGNRLVSLREVIRELGADVIGLQEIMDRRALELLFPPADWDIVIDDEVGESQDVAVVVRRPLKVVSPADLDADDEDFAFPDPNDYHCFPRRRDLLKVQVQVPGGDTFWVLVQHSKSRRGGRASTDPRRECASKKIVQLIDRELDEEIFFLVGDFNDTPDDRSLNILETGDPDAWPGPEESRGAFLWNLTEVLYAAGNVSHGRSWNDVIPGSNRIDTIDPDARDRNNRSRGEDYNTGDQMFDQILIPPRMASFYVPGSVKVFNNAVAVRSEASDWDHMPSDHLPVYADFLLTAREQIERPGREEEVRTRVRIVGLLPNPSGRDAGREQVRLRNDTSSVVDLTGWKLLDRGGSSCDLNGSIEPGGVLELTLPAEVMALTNTGDEITLLNADGEPQCRVAYEESEVVAGEWIELG
jgi:endonuclease/exonuclease/phosphatase family metal-dependent hydrolase